MKLTIYLVSLLLIPLACQAGGPYSDLHASSTDKSVIATLFEWRFDDIADECERFLGPVGYAAVQVSPVYEYAVISVPPYDRPWFERYQPVSYKIISRSGDEAAFSNMVDRCNKAGVRVIVDAVLNHMTHPMDGVGVGGTPFKGKSDKSYPGVPFSPNHFTPREKCPSKDGEVHDYDNRDEVRNCNLFGSHDLNTADGYVRDKLREAVNKVIDLGAVGFRLDASKHMPVEDIDAIFSTAHDLNTKYFPAGSRPFISHEVLLGGKVLMSEYTKLGRVFEYQYRISLKEVFKGQKGKKLAFLKNFGEDWSFSKSNDAVSLIDNQDIQRDEVYEGISFRSVRLLKLATGFMLAWPYGIPNVMSSYDWPTDMTGGKLAETRDRNSHMGPPSDSQKNIEHVVIKNEECQAPWVCEHRWKPIANMVRFRQVAEGEPVTNWWDNGNNAIAFCRGSKGCVMINNEPGKVTATLKTGLPEGNYCDVISGDVKGQECTGKTIAVNANGEATITIDGSSDEVPMVAFFEVPEPAPAPTTTEAPMPEPIVAEPEPEPEPEPEVDQCDRDKKVLDACAFCQQFIMNRKVEL